MRSVHWSTLRNVRILNDPYGWNEQKIILTDRYDAGVLENPQFYFIRQLRVVYEMIYSQLRGRYR